MKFSVLFQSLTNEDVLAVVNYADNNLKVVKFIPDRQKYFLKNYNMIITELSQYLTFRTIPLR